MNHPTARMVERVLVAINSPLRSDDALAAAVELASSFQAPLMALFVEDVNLARLSELPFAKELDRSSGVIRPLNPQSLDRALEAEARKLRKWLQDESKRRRISVSMQVVRGHCVGIAEQMARSRDIVFVDYAVRRYFGNIATGSFLPGQDASRLWDKPVWVLYDGTKRTRRALALASSLGQTYGLDVVILAGEEADDNDIEEQKSKMPSNRKWECQVLRLSDQKSVIAAVRNRGCAALVLPREYEHKHDFGLIGSVMRCPRILV